MPNISKKQLIEISKQYNRLMSEIYNTKDFYEQQYNQTYYAYGQEDSQDKQNEAIALALLAFNHNKLSEFQIDNLLDYAGINRLQLNSIYKNIDDLEFIKEINEKGNAEIDDIALNQNLNDRFKQYAEADEKINKDFEERMNSYKPKSYSYNEIFAFAKDQHDQLLNDKRNNFKNNFKLEYKNKVLFDKEFFMDFIASIGEVENIPKNQNKNDPLYKKAKDNMDYINTLKNTDTIDSQKQIAIDRLNCYTSLKTSFDSKSIGDFFKSPIGFIKEWWTLKNVKKEVKEAYKLTDEALDTIFDIQNKSNTETQKFFDEFEILEPNGKIITKNPSQEEINAVGKKLNVDPSLLLAQNGLNKIKQDFDNDLLNYGTEKSQYHKGIEVQERSNDSFTLE